MVPPWPSLISTFNVKRPLSTAVLMFTSIWGTQVITESDSAFISYVFQRSNGVRNVSQLHVEVPGIVQQCPNHEDGRVGEVNVKLRNILTYLLTKPTDPFKSPLYWPPWCRSPFPTWWRRSWPRRWRVSWCSRCPCPGANPCEPSGASAGCPRSRGWYRREKSLVRPCWSGKCSSWR